MELAKQFRKYPDIENYKERLINRFRILGYNNEEWICMEKIHGVNLSFLTDGGEVVIGKRVSVIEESENFFCCKKILNKYSKDILDLYYLIRADIRETVSIQIFGELFGGYYPNLISMGIPVQREIWYSNQIDYLVYDIQVNVSNSSPFFLSHDETEKYLNEMDKLKGVPIITRGLIDDIININSQINTQIPSIYNLPELNDNIIEGFIFKTNKRHYLHVQRPIFKKRMIDGKK
jgi:Rnl2 family RNA ligase